MIVPTVIEKTIDGERVYDIYSMLLNERIIILTGEINDQVASLVVAQLLYLASKDNKKDIQLYINSPGGSITAGLAIYDTMRHVSCDVSTICLGMAASMGAFLLAGGTHGKRLALPNSEIMIHQPLGGAQGKVSDIDIMTRRLLGIKRLVNKILAENTKKPIEIIEKDTEKDYFMTSLEALQYGIIDKVIETAPKLS
ncbi:atp-dependent clp protease proteolytic subunit [Holotrichia oblita]|nr:atp-dependent clp protease proteolytic subunit [Holotrichia oblita]